MPRGPAITDLERGQILALHKECISFRSIAEAVNRSVGAVQSVIRLGFNHKHPKHWKGNQKISETQKRAIIRMALKAEESARGIQAELKLPIRHRRVQQILSAVTYLKYRKMITAPQMTPQHKENRVKWCRRFISKGEEFWNTVVFSDEKKFNGDGPDGFASYWHDLRTKERIFSKRQNGGFSVMVWGAISLYGVSPIVFMDGRQDSTKYVDVLRHGLLPFSSEVFGEGQGWVFQQDNAPIHTSNFTRTWLSGHSIRTLPWPPKSPDMNIIENVWGVMARVVYARGRHYQNVRELKDAIEEAWSTVGSDLLLKLYKSLPRRMHAVMDARGGATKY
ncbi:unnamed protein product [Chondrus crispus]|uniref:Tc1-like transposase DDE domain-containing protein n=1 Tax=Chondrus crispus TaxID=2769 RepID=R7QTX7_CHOCR|nr:unnamed protein product [Chondrus crispus]CDF40946.1 unnamed protein product [Chondrus crispus]|eukprot:XP_005711240.1 unnamed protein product [Chondrus crispus]